MTALTTSGITYAVEVAFTTDLLDVPGTWTDISDYVRQISTRRGRNHELGKMQAGEVSITLDNRDRRFDPSNQTTPLLHYAFEETAGSSANDSSPNNRDGTIGAGVTKNVTGHTAQAFGFSNLTNNNWVSRDLTGVIPGGAFTFDLWAKSTGLGGGNPRFWQNSTSGGINWNAAFINSSTVSFALLPTGSGTVVTLDWPHGGALPTDGLFHHYQFTFDGTTMAIWMDGVMRASQALGASTVNWAHADDFVIGNSEAVTSGADAFVGTIDEFAIYPSVIPSAISPYAPNVIPMRHIRARATYASTTYPVFYGFVEDWGQRWPAPAANAQGDAYVDVHAVDAFKIFALMQVRSYRAEVLADEPLLYWPLDETSGDTFASLGSLEAATMGTTGFGPTGTSGPFSLTTAVNFLASSDVLSPSEGPSIPESPPIGTDFTWEAWVRFTSAPASRGDVLFAGGSASQIGQIGINSARHVTMGIPQVDGSSTEFTSTAQIALSTWAHIAVVVRGRMVELYIDGALSQTFGPVGGPPYGYNSAPFIGGDNSTHGFVGKIAHVATYRKALDPSRVEAHATAAYDIFTDVGSGAAIEAILDGIGWPAGLRSIDDGASTITLSSDGSALDVLQQIAEDTEHGLLMMAADNVFTFVGRDTLEQQVTAAATFGDGTGEVPYRDLQLANDDQDLWTEVALSGPGGSVVVTDTAAATIYGRRTLSITTLAATPNEVADQAAGLLNRYKAPATRPQTLVLNRPVAFPEQLGRSIGDRVMLLRRPPGGGTIMVDALIEGVNHDAGSDGYLTTTFALVPTETQTAQTFWLLGDTTYGILDSTTRLGW